MVLLENKMNIEFTSVMRSLPQRDQFKEPFMFVVWSETNW